MTDSKLELFAIVELFGHSRIAGKVTEQTVGSSTFIRVDVPPTKTQGSFTRIINPSAVYAINPVTEDVSKEMAERIQQKPIEAWDWREMEKRLMALKENNSHEQDPDDDHDDEDY
jgi:hypothetical protein